ncbi:hypothetical protein BJX61DRAFT_239969 [Aspergillus egyptiacus]|nr:hypothetical protein BJX61DRAFT_239969 [Aspergillus egyptiacus]
MDSMLAAEFRTRFYQAFKVDIPFLTLLAESTTLSVLGELVHGQISQEWKPYYLLNSVPTLTEQFPRSNMSLYPGILPELCALNDTLNEKTPHGEVLHGLLYKSDTGGCFGSTSVGVVDLLLHTPSSEANHMALPAWERSHA